MSVQWDRNLLPEDFVRSWRERKRPQIMAEYGDAPVLLIEIGDRSSELAIGLGAAPTTGGERLVAASSLGFQTVVANADDVQELMHRSRPGFALNALKIQVMRAPHFIAPLRKRSAAGRPYQNRISVGRATNNDIVLRHHSVSKFHGWFECDADGQYLVTDAGSKNGTVLNGAPLQKGDLKAISSGDRLEFGRVAATICGAEHIFALLTGTD